MVHGNKIIERVDIEYFLEIIKNYDPEQVECTNHTFFRLNDEQRKVFKCEYLRNYIIYEYPILVGIQKNKNYAVFYKYENKVIKIIIDIQIDKINIVTFYFIENSQIPRI